MSPWTEQRSDVASLPSAPHSSLSFLAVVGVLPAHAAQLSLATLNCYWFLGEEESRATASRGRPRSIASKRGTSLACCRTRLPFSSGSKKSATTRTLRLSRCLRPGATSTPTSPCSLKVTIPRPNRTLEPCSIQPGLGRLRQGVLGLRAGEGGFETSGCPANERSNAHGYLRRPSAGASGCCRKGKAGGTESGASPDG